MVRRAVLLASCLFASIVAVHAASAQTKLPAEWQPIARDVLRDIVNVNTAEGGEGTTKAAKIVARHLVDAGFADSDVQLIGPDPANQNLVTRLHGAGNGRPILLIAHLDTVTARKEDWTSDPFVFTEKDGWWYGRGIVDDKTGVGTLVANLVRWKKEGFRPARDVIVLLTTAEETDAKAGIEWVVANRRDLIDAEYCLNTDGGGGRLAGGRPAYFGLQAAEKVYQSYRLEVTNAGGHSSLPRPDNAIYQLSQALVKLAAFAFPVQLTEVSRQFFARSGAIEAGAEGADLRAIAVHPDDAAVAARLSRSPLYNSILRTTCVATRLDAGHADNALPQRAAAIVNCRILPGIDPADVQRTLAQVVSDPAVTISALDPAHPSPPSPLRPEVVGPVEELVRLLWNVPVVPMMSTGASDGLYLRNAGIPTYGIGGLFEDPGDIRAHGRDERVEPSRYYDAVEFWYRVVKALAK